MLEWQWLLFNELSRDQLYEILKVRQAVFTVEQDCAYQDADDLDQRSWHLMGWRNDPEEKTLVAYLRVVIPGSKYPEPSMGRILVARSVRRTGLGKTLMREAITRTLTEYPGSSIRISAQQHLENFYSTFGFTTVSEPYDEDGIPHVEMLRNPQS
jgi:ElaA protein